MFIIQRITNGLYFSNKGRIILFNTSQEAEVFLQAFYQYALNRIGQETQDPLEFLNFQKTMNEIYILELDFEGTPPCGIINYLDLLNERD